MERSRRPAKLRSRARCRWRSRPHHMRREARWRRPPRRPYTARTLSQSFLAPKVVRDSPSARLSTLLAIIMAVARIKVADASAPEAGNTAYRRLREGIANGQFHPNERLVEASVATRLGVGRTAVRAALVRL